MARRLRFRLLAAALAVAAPCLATPVVAAAARIRLSGGDVALSGVPAGWHVAIHGHVPAPNVRQPPYAKQPVVRLRAPGSQEAFVLDVEANDHWRHGGLAAARLGPGTVERLRAGVYLSRLHGRTVAYFDVAQAPIVMGLSCSDAGGDTPVSCPPGSHVRALADRLHLTWTGVDPYTAASDHAALDALARADDAARAAGMFRGVFGDGLFGTSQPYEANLPGGYVAFTTNTASGAPGTLMRLGSHIYLGAPDHCWSHLERIQIGGLNGLLDLDPLPVPPASSYLGVSYDGVTGDASTLDVTGRAFDIRLPGYRPIHVRLDAQTSLPLEASLLPFWSMTYEWGQTVPVPPMPTWICPPLGSRP
jgi:hypothetical protein